jgi:hypothetical protein
MKDNGFRKVMLLKTDEELLDIIQNKRDDYQEKAVLDIEAILTERGIDFRVLKEKEVSLEKELIPDSKDLLIENGESKIEKDVSKNNTETGSSNTGIYGPILVGIIMVLSAFINIDMEVSPDDAIIFSILLNIVFRIIVLLWTLELVKKYRLNKAIWIIVGLLFGGWQLIAINIAIWIVPENDLKEHDIDE